MSNKNLHLEFIDEGIRLVNAAEEQGIQLRILGSIAYRLQCPIYVHMFDAMQRVLTDVDFAGLKKQNRAIREFMLDQGYKADEGVYVASEGYCQVKRNQSHFVSQLVGRRTKNQQPTANSMTFVLLSEH